MNERTSWKRPRYRVLAVCLLLGLVSATSTADDDRSMGEQLASAGLTLPETKVFFTKLKHAVATGDRSALAAMARFPLVVAVGTDTVTLADTSAFEQRYADFMTPPLVALVGRTAFDDLFANYQGVMIGNGAIWFGPVCEVNGEPQPLDSCNDAPIRLLRVNGL
jgi:hypothetical protein